MMTIDEAIKHCNEIACKHNKCAMEHKQLAECLKELNELKKMKAELMKNAIDGHIINDDGTHILICPSLPIVTRDMEEGDRVKVIVLKKEQL